MVWYGSPEYNARLKTAAKRIALDHVLHELVIEVARLHASPVDCLNELQAKVHARFTLDEQSQGHELHVQAEAARYSDEYFESARDALSGKQAADGDSADSQNAA